MVGVEEAKPPEALEILQLTLAKKCKKIYPCGSFVNICLVLVQVTDGVLQMYN